MSIEYKSQYGQDKWIIEHLFPNKRDGFFIEIGAGDGEIISNTWTLEKELGWKGICIEPHPENFPVLQANRTAALYNKVIADFNGEVDYYQVKDNVASLALFSGLNVPKQYNEMKIVKMPCVTLHTALEELNCPKVVDYLSMDTEGSDLAILKKFFGENKERQVLVISIEKNDKIYDLRVRELLTPLGFKKVTTVVIDDIYVHSSLKQ
jgi:FkbM family methyltransferase